MAITTATILFIMFVVLVIANSSTVKSEWQTWLMGTIPTLGTFLLISISATALAAIPAIYQNITKFLKK